MEWSVSDNFLRNEFVRRVLVWNAPKTISYSHSQNQDKEWNENRKIYIYIISFIAAAGMEKCALRRTMCALENTQTPRNHQCDQDQWSEFYTRTLSLMLLLIEIIYDKFMIKLPFVLRVFFLHAHTLANARGHTYTTQPTMTEPTTPIGMINKNIWLRAFTTFIYILHKLLS